MTVMIILDKIHHHDVLLGLKSLADNSADCVLIDPPYNIGKNFMTSKDNMALADYVVWCEAWLQESLRIAKPGASIFIYGFSEILARLAVLRPLALQRWLVWHYTNKNVASLQFWQRSHESILLTWKDTDKPIFYRDAVREPYTDGFLKGAAGKTRAATKGRFSSGDKSTVYEAHQGGALPRDVIKVPALAGGAGMRERWFFCENCDDVFPGIDKHSHDSHVLIFHPTQKPLELTKRLLYSCMPKNGLVVVPFAGTGSECAMAAYLDYQFIGFDNNPVYAKMGNDLITKNQQFCEHIKK